MSTHGTSARISTPEDLIAEFETRMGLQHPERQDIVRQAGVLRRMITNLGLQDVSQITTANIERYLEGRKTEGRAAKTLFNDRTTISGFCRFLQGRGILADNPCSAVRLAKTRRKPSILPYLDDEEVELALSVAERVGIWPEVRLALSTGLRLGELVRLQWGDIDEDNRLCVRKSNAERGRVVPLDMDAQRALQEQHEKTGDFTYVFPARQTWRGGWRYLDQQRCIGSLGRTIRPIQEAIPKFIDGKGTGRGWHMFRRTYLARGGREFSLEELRRLQENLLGNLAKEAEIGDNEFRFPQELAKHFKVPFDERFRSRLRRLRAQDHESFREQADRKPREPQFRYRVGSVRPLIESLKAAAKTTGERPAKKK